MKFQALFSRSAVKLTDCPVDGLPEIAVTGRSNVGKSSLINSLAERKQLARVSGTPGKTQVLNYFKVNDKFYLVDMPGYGYAKRSKTERAQWAKMIETYLTDRKELRAVGVLVDSRHDLMDSDREAIAWLAENEVPMFVVMTKGDQSKQADLGRLSRSLRAAFGDIPIIGTSSKNGRGISQLQEFIKNLAVETEISRDE